MENALECFERENYNHHLIPEGYLFLAKLSFETGDCDKSIRHLAMVESLVEGSPQHNFIMAILYQRMGKHREALRMLRKLPEKDYTPMLFPTEPLPTPSELLLHMAYSRYCIDEHREALELINASAPPGADMHKSWEWIGRKAYLFDNIELAAIAFETAQRFGMLDKASWESLAAIYKSKGFARKAEECLMRAACRV